MKTCFYLSLLFVLCVFTNFVTKSQTYTCIKKRPSQVNTSAYKQIAIGDIVGAYGQKTEQSLNLSDAVASNLFKANAQEILDRNALEKIFFATSKLTVIDETTITQLKKKIKEALLVTGRIQTSSVNQQQVSQQQGIVVNGCTYMYYWKAVCNVTVQIKIVDINTGKMLFTGPVAQQSEFETKSECTSNIAKLDEVAVLQTTMDSAASKIAHLLVPYTEEIQLAFANGTLFKHPFKKINDAIADFQMTNNEAALAILKNYTQDASLKDNFKAQAHYNYGLALFINRQYEEAKNEFKTAFALQPESYYQQWYTKMDEEKAMNDKLIASNK